MSEKAICFTIYDHITKLFGDVKYGLVTTKRIRLNECVDIEFNWLNRSQFCMSIRLDVIQKGQHLFSLKFLCYPDSRAVLANVCIHQNTVLSIDLNEDKFEGEDFIILNKFSEMCLLYFIEEIKENVTSLN